MARETGSFLERLSSLRERIGYACERSGRDPDEVDIVAVTKRHPASAWREAFDAGLRRFGENYVKEAEEKYGDRPQGLLLHGIGEVQSNKARRAARCFDVVETIGSKRELDVVEGAAAAAGKVLPVLIEVRQTEGRHGAEAAEAEELARDALTRNGLDLRGFMTVASRADSVVAKWEFENLATLAMRIREVTGAPLFVLSMGMSGDFEAGIAAGSTEVRIGTALFGERKP